MGWAEIIAAIMKMVGPLLNELLKKWLEKLLNKAAKGLGPVPACDGYRTVLAAAADAIPRRQVVRRALARKLADHAAEIEGLQGWAKADRAEVKALAEKAAAE